MNKILGLLSILVVPVLLCAQNNAPAAWRTTKTCPEAERVQDEFYQTLKSPQQFKDVRYLAETCKADVTDKDALYLAALSNNYPATKYLFPKVQNANPAELLAFLNLETSGTTQMDASAEKSLSKICNFLAGQIIQRRQILGPELYYAARLDYKAFKKLYKYGQKHALQAPVQLSGSVMKECVIWRTEAKANNRPLTAFIDKNMQKSCKFALKHEPQTTQQTLKYIFFFQPELVNDYLNKDTAAWLLAQAAEVAPKQYWPLLEELGAQAAPNALFSAEIYSPEHAKFLLRLGAKPSELALAKFIKKTTPTILPPNTAIVSTTPKCRIKSSGCCWKTE